MSAAAALDNAGQPPHLPVASHSVAIYRLPCTSLTRCSNFSTISADTLSHTLWIAAACSGDVKA